MIKFLSILMVVFMVLSVWSIANAGNLRTSGLYTYEFKGNGTLRIVDFDWNSNSTDIYIPSMIDGYEVSIIGERAFELSEEEKASDVIITLPNTVKTIEEFAFLNAPVTAINIPTNTKYIGRGAMLVSPTSKKVNFNVASGHSTFATIDGVLYNKTERELIAYPINGTLDFEVPKGIVSIGDYAFWNWHGIKKIVLPETVISVGEYAFYNNTLESRADIEIPDTIQTIGDYAFSNIYMYAKDNEIRSIVENALSIPTSLKAIPDHAYEDSVIRDGKIIIPNGVGAIGNYAFYNNCNHANIAESFQATVQLIEIPGSVESVGNYAFAYLTSDYVVNPDYKLKKIIIKSGVETLGEGAFENTKPQEEVIIEEGLNEIGDNCFRNCKGPGIASIIIPGTVTSIGSGAFENSSVTNVVIGEGTKSLGNNCFKGCYDLTITLPSTISSIPTDAFERTTTHLIVTEGSYAETYAIENGITYQYEQREDDTSWLFGDVETPETEEPTDWLNP